MAISLRPITSILGTTSLSIIDNISSRHIRTELQITCPKRYLYVLDDTFHMTVNDFEIRAWGVTAKTVYGLHFKVHIQYTIIFFYLFHPSNLCWRSITDHDVHASSSCAPFSLYADNFAPPPVVI